MCKSHKLSATTRRQCERLLNFLELNGWEITTTKKGHLRLEHPIAGGRYHSGTSGDRRAELNCISQCKNMMRNKNVPIKG